MVRFDAYSATTSALKPWDVVPWLKQFAGDKLRQGKGFHTFGERLAVEDDTGTQVGAIQWGGRQGDRIMVEVKGERTPGVVGHLRAAASHRCTRVDACVDWEEPGAFERLLAHCREVKAEHRLYGEQRGDWEQPHLGRTFTLGAKASAVTSRLYEKGCQPEYRHLERWSWVRLEVQVRPAKEAKELYSGLSPMQVWGASAWTRDLAGRALGEQLSPFPAASQIKRTSLEQRLWWIGEQCGPTLLELLEDVGSWDCVGRTVGDYVQQVAALKRKRRM